jgi:hypothetical protein
MPQHLWQGMLFARRCEVCKAIQLDCGKGWSPHVDPICPGDDEDGPSSRRRRGTRPDLPTSGPATPVRELEPA